MKRVIVLIMVILSMVLTGCWDLTDPEKLGLVTLIGIDTSSDNQVRVVVQEIPYQKQTSGQQSGSSGGGSPEKLHEAEASTIYEAVEKITASDFRRTYFPHASAIILSEELVSSVGLSPIMDYLERTSQIRRSIWILIAEKGQFNKIFDVGAGIEPGIDIGKVIKEIIENRTVNSHITANSFTDFFTYLWETGSEPYTAGIGLINIAADKTKQGSDSKSGESNIYDLVIENTAVFKKDKMVGWMDRDESMGLLWATGGIKGGAVTVKLNDKDVVLKILKTNSNIKPMITDGKLQVSIRVKVTSDVTESKENIDFGSNEVINKLQDLQAEEIKKEILSALNKSKSLNSDVFGFGNYFFGKYPKYWKQIGANWYDYYQDIDINIDVSSKVDHIGLIKKTR